MKALERDVTSSDARKEAGKGEGRGEKGGKKKKEDMS